MPYERDPVPGRRPPERERHSHGGRRAGGVPDGLLMGVLGFLLGLTALTWTATGLSAWLTHGRWPEGLDFPHTPRAMRRLLTEPQDLAAAWPDVSAAHLPGPGLFWGILIGQLMVLTVLGAFVLGTLARWRARRAARTADVALGTAPAAPAQGTAPDTGQEKPPEPARPAAPVAASPRPSSPAAHDTAAGTPAPGTATAAGGAGGAGPEAAGLVLGPQPGAAAEAVREAEGAVVVVTADAALYADTVGARAKLGPVHVYDPQQRTGAPSRLRWAPHHGCHDMDTARTRAAALLAPVRSPVRGDEAVQAAAEALLRCWLHAAAVAGEPFRQVHRWALTGSSKDAVRVLRTDTRAAAGAAGELEATLTAYPERREAAGELVRRALHCVSRLHIRNASTPTRADRIAWESFVAEGGSLYVVGESLEAPHRGDPAALPLATALTAAVVEHGRRMAARSSAGRLDPPMTVVLDDPATVAPVPDLPALLADGASCGLVTYALLRSEEQLRTWWPELAARGTRSR